MANYKEELKGQMERYDAHADSVRTEKDVKSEIQDLPMHIEDKKTEALDGVKKGVMGKAVEHLNKETQRGEHAPMVGGYKHDNKMR
jgi:hypothetical protein